jgi:hypothetical protein
MKSPLDRGGLRFFLVLVAVAGRSATRWTVLAGVPLVVLGAALHLWAKGCLRQNQVVTKIGPYRYVRHPFYLANALVDVSIAVMSGWWVLQVLLPVWWLVAYLPVMRREEEYLTGAFGAAYEEYKKRVPRLLPWRRPLPRTGEGFSWRNPNIAAGDEGPRAMKLLAYPLLFFIVADLRAEGLSFFTQGLDVLALTGLVVLYGLAWGLRRVLCRSAVGS